MSHEHKSYNFVYGPFQGSFYNNMQGDYAGHAELSNCTDWMYEGPIVEIEWGPLDVVKKLMESTLHDMLVAWLETSVMIVSDRLIKSDFPKVSITMGSDSNG